MNYTDLNAATIDRWVEEGWEWGIPISHEEYRKAAAGDWSVLLTPTKPVPKTWFPLLRGCRVLGLAAGGGQQMPVFAALGGECTVLDYSPRQIASERKVAEREGYAIEIVRADMTKPLPFDPLVNEDQRLTLEKEDCGIQFSHSIAEQIGGQLRAGFTLLDVYDDTNGEGYLHEHGVPCFWATLARKPEA